MTKHTLIKIAIIVLVLLVAVWATVVIVDMRIKHQKLMELLIPSDSNKIEAYSELSSINLPLNDPYQQIRVVHFGDSHIQAGTITKKLRELLSKYVGEAKQSEGYVFPYNIVKTNSPCSYTFETNAEWTFDKITLNPDNIEAGIAGLFMKTNSSNAELTLKLSGYAAKNSSFNKIRIFYQNNSQSFAPRIADSLILSSFHGDDFIEFTLNKELRQITIKLQATSNIQTNFVLTGIQVENCASKLVYSAAGLNGASAKTYLRATKLISQISSLNPNLVIISLGTNDAYNDVFNARKFAKDLNKIVESIKDAVPNCPILLTIPSDHYWLKEYSNPNLVDTRNQIIKVANNNGCFTWDLYSIMGGAGSMGTWQTQGFSANDLIHFTTKGYNLQAQMLFNALVDNQNGSPIINPIN